MHSLLFFTAALVSAAHLKSEKNVIITQTTTECTGSSGCSSATSSSSIFGTSSNGALNTLSSSTLETPSSNSFGLSTSVNPNTPSDYTYDLPPSSILNSTSGGMFSTLLSNSSGIPSIPTTSVYLSCAAGASCTFPTPASNVIETSPNTVLKTSSSSTSSLMVYVPAATFSTTISTPNTSSSTQQESQSWTLPEPTTTIIRTRTTTRIRTYYTQSPTSELWHSEQSESNVHSDHAWHNIATTTSATGTIADTIAAPATCTIAKTVTITVIDTTTVTVTDPIADTTTGTAMVIPTAITTTYPNYSAPKSFCRSCQVSHYEFHNTTIPQANHATVINPTLNRTIEPSSTLSLRDESIAVITSATDSPTPIHDCLLDQNACQSSSGSVMISEFHGIERSKVSRVFPRQLNTATPIPSKAVPDIPVERGFQHNVPAVVHRKTLACGDGNRPVQQSLTVVDHANKTKIASASGQTNMAQDEYINLHLLPMVDESNDVVTEPVSKQLVPLQEETTSTRPDLNLTTHHIPSTAVTTTTVLNTSIRTVTGAASGMECSYVALVIAMAILVL